MQEYNIFISYSRKDAALVECVVSLLRAIGANAFRDKDSIPAGVKWRPVLEDALDKATVILVFWCIHSESSVEVRAEFQRAIDGQKSLIPIILDDTPLVVDLSQFQGIDMRPIIGDHRKDSISTRIERHDPPWQSLTSNRQSYGPSGNGWNANIQDMIQNIHKVAAEADQRKKVFDEVARKIYEGIPDCIH